MNEVDIITLRGLLRYEAETGKLFWLPRPTSLFGSKAQSQEHNAKIWNAKYANKEAFTCDLKGYQQGRIFRRSYLAHRVAWALYYGNWPEGEIDHINGNRSDNRIENLRDVPPTVNGQNKCMRSDNSSGAMGVFWCRTYQKWQASIRVWGKLHFLGRFEQLEDAIAARRSGEIKHGFHPNHGRAA